MILTKEQFDKHWGGGTLCVVDWFDTTLSLFEQLEESQKCIEDFVQPKTCSGCVKEQSKLDNGGACTFWCSRDFTQDQYKPKDNQ